MKTSIPHASTRPPDNAILSRRYVERHQFDEDYLRRLIDRDPATERHFVSYFGDLLTIKLRSKLRYADLIEDARQETLVRVLHTLRMKGGIATPHALGAYVNSVCNNVLFEMYRAESKSPTLTDELPEIASHESSVESEMVSEQNRAKVRRVLMELPPKDRELLYAYFFAESDKDAICRRIGVDREYLRVLFHRAKNRFRDGFAKAQGA